MYWLGVVLATTGVLLLAFTNPWQFFKAAEGTFFDWTEVFWYLQWGGFWLLSASLLVFGSLAWKEPAGFALRWKVVPAGAALLAWVLFFVCSMPERSNQKDWKNGWLGARVYVRTKIWLRGDDRDEAALPDRLAGKWQAAGGLRFSISPEEIRILSPSREAVWNARSCRHRFRMDYDFTFRPALERPLPDGLAFTPFNQTASTAITALPDRRFPRLSCSCDTEATTWVLVDIDRLIVFIDSEPALLARRS